MKCGVWPWQSRPPALVQVEGVEREAARSEVIGQLGVEEVVGVAVQGEHGAAGPAPVPAPDERGDELAFAVGIRAEGNGLPPVSGQHVGLPTAHDSHLNRAV